MRLARTAHDVRRLCQCACCRKLADDRETVRVNGEHYHGACAYETYGLQGALKLPEKERAKFRMSDMPNDHLRQVWDF